MRRDVGPAALGGSLPQDGWPAQGAGPKDKMDDLLANLSQLDNMTIEE